MQTSPVMDRAAVDPRCGLPLPQLSLALNLLLPRAAMSDRQEWADALSTKTARDTTICVSSGSRVEGLNLPLLLRAPPSCCPALEATHQSDVDVMTVRPDLLATNHAMYDGSHLLLETHDLHPGYVRLRCPLTNTIQDRSLLGNFWRRKMETQGPAKVHRSGIGESDAVLCIMSEWPNFGTEWVTRGRASGWPGVALRQRVISEGCHVVPIAHHRSSNPDVEWRFSFSKAEQTLASTLSEVQRQCYLFLKMFHVQELKSPKVLATYHLKTIMLWACEAIPGGYWTSRTLGECLLYLLDQLVHCLSRHCIPHYFIPTNNLIDHIPRESVATVLQTVARLRNNPLKYLVNFKETYRFMSGPFSANLQQIFLPLLVSPVEGQRGMLGIFAEVGFQMAAAYVKDLPIASRLAKDKALTDVFANETPGNLKNYVRRLVIPFMCVTEILAHIAQWQMAISGPDVLSCLRETIEKLYRDMYAKDSSRYYSDDTLKCIELGRPTLPVSELAGSLAVALRSNDVCLHLRTLVTEGGTNTLTVLRTVLSTLCATFVILTQHPDPQTVHEEQSRLMTLRTCLYDLHIPEYVVSCVDMILGHSYLKEGQWEEAEQVLQQVGLPTDIVSTWRGWYGLNQADWYDTVYGNPEEVDAICYGRVFTQPQCEPFLSVYSEPGLLVYNVFRPLPPENLFRPVYQRLSGEFLRASLENKEEGSAGRAQAKTDYASFLIHVARFREATDVLQDLISSQGSLTQFRCSYFGPTNCAVHMGVLMRGADDSSERKIEFPTKPYAYFLLVQCLVKQGRKAEAQAVLSHMEETCDRVADDVTCNCVADDVTKAPWEVLANSYSLLGFAHELCGDHRRALLAHCLVTSIQRDRHNAWPPSARIRHLFREPETTTWAIESAVSRYVAFLLPDVSRREAVGLLLRTLCPYVQPVTPGDVNEKVATVIQEVHTLLKAIYPGVCPTESIASFLTPLGPALEETVLQVFTDLLEEAPKVWMRTLLLVLYEHLHPDVPNLPVWLRGYVTTFYPDTSPRRALAHFFLRLYPGVPTADAISEFFAIAGLTPQEMSKAFTGCHGDPEVALLVTVFLDRQNSDPVTPFLQAAFPGCPSPDALRGVIGLWAPSRTPLESLVSFSLTAYPDLNAIQALTAVMKAVYPDDSLQEAKHKLTALLM